MELICGSPIRYDIDAVPGSTIVCEIRTKATKKVVKIDVALYIYYRHPSRNNLTNVISSNVNTIYTSKVDRTHIIKINVPQFKNSIQSFVLIQIDPTKDIHAKATLDTLIVEEYSKYKSRQKQIEEYALVKKRRLANISKKIASGEKVSGEKASEEKTYRKEIGKIEEEKIGVICEGLMLGHSGFAKAMRNVSLGLDKIGCNVKTIVLDNDTINFLDTEQGHRITKLIANRKESNYHFWITMNNPMAVSRHDDHYSIGYVMFETKEFPHMYAQHLAEQDEIWTPSKFCKDAIEKEGLNSVHVMPLGVDTDEFNPKNANAAKLPDNIKDKYKFLSVMGYSERKGVSILVEAFAEEFQGNDDVALYIKGGWYDSVRARKEINDKIRNITNPPIIYTDFNIYPEDVLASIYNACDCFVLPTRGEGFALPVCEAMSMEMPVIVTKWGGQLEYANNENSYLINVERFAPEPRCDWICGEYIGRNFAVPSKSHLKELMRYVYENKEDAEIKGKKAREDIVNNFTWDKCCNRIYERLKKIADDAYDELYCNKE